MRSFRRSILRTEASESHELNNIRRTAGCRDCVEFSGQPEEENENTNKLVIKVGSLVGLELNESDISAFCHRLAKPSYKPSYIGLLRISDNKIYISESL